MKCQSVLAFIVLTCVGYATAADPVELTSKPRLAVLDFRTDGKVDETGSKLFSAAVREEFNKSGHYDLMDRGMMRERMTEKDFAATIECDEVRCLVRYGRSLDVQKIVGGYAASFGGGYMLTMRLVDVNIGREERSFARSHTGEMFDLLELARVGAAELLGEEMPRAAAVSRESTTRRHGTPDELTLDLGGGVTMDLVLIREGEFRMGSPGSEVGRREDEGPEHTVRISKPFYMARTEVTQAQWKAVMGADENPSHFSGDRLPVEQVSWHDCQRFCRRLSRQTGEAVRLPTEAEWEYACRAGSAARFCFGNSEAQLGEHAWHIGNWFSGNPEPPGANHPVRQKEPNAWGLYDMHGNVGEWCIDWYGPYTSSPATDPTGPPRGEHRVIRGCSMLVSGHPRLGRSAFRMCGAPGDGFAHFGFRVVLGGVLIKGE